MSSIDPAWLVTTQASVGRAATELACTDLQDAPGLVDPLVAAIAPAPDLVHAAVLSTELLEGCRRILEAAHETVASEACTCCAMSWTYVSRFAKWREQDPRLVFRDWLRAFLEFFAREHPPTRAAQVAALVRRHPTHRWTVNELAARAHLGPGRLREAFHAQYGVKPSAYVQLVRAARAVALLRAPTKVEAVALEVGYRSKKDLYAALTRWVGATPTELRALSEAERDWLEEQLRVRCVRGLARVNVACGAPEPADMRGSHPPSPRRQSTRSPRM